MYETELRTIEVHSKSQTKAHIHQRTLANTFKQFEKAVLHEHIINMVGGAGDEMECDTELFCEHSSLFNSSECV